MADKRYKDAAAAAAAAAATAEVAASAAKLGSQSKRQGFCAVLLTAKWQTVGRAGEQAGKRFLLFLHAHTTATINSKNKT